ncbi:hypothetical protein COB55_02365 [Candidatus Wolfebacteria bacterium]|nr:MAG: hypothetical protein COB55_02365 [Candidatus Wolfebacteria bacterium]
MNANEKIDELVRRLEETREIVLECNLLKKKTLSPINKTLFQFNVMPAQSTFCEWAGEHILGVEQSEVREMICSMQGIFVKRSMYELGISNPYSIYFGGLSRNCKWWVLPCKGKYACFDGESCTSVGKMRLVTSIEMCRDFHMCDVFISEIEMLMGHAIRSQRIQYEKFVGAQALLNRVTPDLDEE